MSDVFISYAKATTANEARAVADALQAEGYSVWWDDQLPSHRAYSDVIEEQLQTAKAVVVIWSAEAVKSEWVRSEANRAREDRKLVQVIVDTSRLPMPFDQIQCADLAGWSGNAGHPGWLKALASVAELVAGRGPTLAPEGLRAATTLALPDKPSIAVLPFADLSPGKDQDYFCDGMVEEVVAALTRFPALFVIAGRSGLAYRGDKRPPREIAAELGVRYLLDGSVRQSGVRLRIAVSLADAIEGDQVWSDRFDGDLDDVFDLQEEVASAVATRIAPSIRAADMRRARARPRLLKGNF